MARFPWGKRGAPPSPAQGVGTVEHRAVCRPASAVRAHRDASVGQHVLKTTTETLFSTHLTACALRGGRLLVLQSDRARCALEDAGIADGHSQEGRRTISPGVLATAHGRRGHAPVCVPDARVDEGTEGRLCQGIAARGTEDHGERLDVDEARVA